MTKTKYRIEIVFETDRELTPDEQYRILDAAQVQAEEPVDENQDDLDVGVRILKTRITTA